MPLYAIIDHLLYRTFLENITYFDFGRNHGKSIYQKLFDRLFSDLFERSCFQWLFDPLNRGDPLKEVKITGGKQILYFAGSWLLNTWWSLNSVLLNTG